MPASVTADVVVPPPQAVLLIKTSSLGDVIHNLPVVTDLKRQFPDLAIDWVVEDAFADIPRLHPGVRRVVRVALRRWRREVFARQTREQWRRFRTELTQQHYDAVLDTQGLLKSGLIAWLARGRRYGYAAEAAREPLAARFYNDTFVIPRNLHAVERNRWLAAAALDYPPPDAATAPLDYGIRAAPIVAEWLPVGPYVVLLTATSRDDKLWADAHWSALAAFFNDRGLPCVLPAGSAVERVRAARLSAVMRMAIAAPPLGIAALASLIAGAALVVGVDTGLTHLAAALGRPVIALFAGSDPGLTGVVAATPAINLGGKGRPPSPDEVATRARELLEP